MANCFDDYQPEDLDSCINTEVQAGLSEVGLYYAIHEHILAFPMPLNRGEVGFTFEKGVLVATPITFVEGKGWAKLTFQPDTGEGLVDLVGNKGNKKTKNSVVFFIPGNSATLLGYFTTMKNIPSLYLYTERDGQKRVVGDKFNPAYMTEVKATTGKGGEDEKGVMITIESYAKPIVYTSTLQLPVVTP